MVKSILLTTLLGSQPLSKRLNPYLDQEYARNVDKAIISQSKAYKVPFNVIFALAKIESNFQVSAINKKSSDYGILQINKFNIKAYKFNKKKLLHDVDYSVKCGIIVFKWFYKKYPLDEAIARFHCGTRENCPKWKNTIKYVKKVKKYL